MLCLSRKRMVITKDRPHGPGPSVPVFIVVECEDHSAIKAPRKGINGLKSLSITMTTLPYHKLLVTYYLTKVAQIIGNILSCFEKPHSYVKLLWLLFGQHLEKFGLLLLQHLVTMVANNLLRDRPIWPHCLPALKAVDWKIKFFIFSRLAKNRRSVLVFLNQYFIFFLLLLWAF